MIQKLLILTSTLILCLSAFGQTKDYTRWVNPFIGTGGHGHTFPGATVPFGMVQLSPDTRIDNWDGSSGYHYSDDIIYGFSHTHLSGTGIPDGCDILFMPTVGEPQFFAKDGDKSVNGYASKFSHANEKAEPGYYSVKLDDDGILAEMTATKRVGMHRYTFSKSEEINIILDLKWRDKVLDSELNLVGNNRLEGYRRSSSWAKNQVVYFVAEFSKPFENSIVTDGKSVNEFTYAKGTNIQTAFKFKTTSGEKLLIKVALSPVSIEGARENLQVELPGWDFEKTRASAKIAWNKELGRIEVSGGSADQTTNFYTALYHMMIHPNIAQDINGQYRGADGKVRQVPANFSLTRYMLDKSEREQARANGTYFLNHYTVFSLWDTFRAAHPLYTIIDQKRTVDFINTFTRIYEHGGRLPVWELWGEETDTMIGYHAVSVIADAMAKDITGFSYDAAYAAAKKSAELDHFGLAAYKRRGYISMEDENESVSKTLEYAYNDWCIAQMAKILISKKKAGSGYGGDFSYKELENDYRRFSLRARYFENLFDTKIGFFRPKKNGGFVEPFAPNEVTFGFTEGNSWQYSFFAPHDVTRLMELMGGREKFVAKLDELFTTDQKLAGREQADLTGLIGQYAHGNEPSHHITYLYNYAGEPWKTQKYVRRIMDEFYKNTPDGLIGNEDCGQMSAWYILSASGFYPVNPGDGIYAIGTPLFPEVTYRLENGKSFAIRAKNVSDKNIYIAAATINGMPYDRAFIDHSTLMRGGVLEFVMKVTPSKTAFTRMPSSGWKVRFPAVPIIQSTSPVFDDKATITLTTVTPRTEIYYTLDGRNPVNAGQLYSKPIEIRGTTTIRAMTQVEKVGGEIPQDVGPPRSAIAEAMFTKRLNDWTVKVLSGYSTQYTGGGDNAIVDGIRGTVNFASGEWQGVQGKPYEAIVDLRRETEIRELGAGFLQVAGPWIWMPDRIEFETSNDGSNFTRVAEIQPNFPQREMTPSIKEFTQTIPAAKARYVRIRAHNFGKILAWHPGAGGDPWIFIDEILIR